MSEYNESGAKEVFSFDQLRGIMRGNKQVDIIDFPGTNMKVGIRVLSQYEIDRCWYDAELKFSKDPNYSTQNFRELISFSKELERQQLYRAVVQVPESSESPLVKFFPNPEAVGEISQDLTVLLLTKYNETQDRYNPAVGIKSPEDLDKLYEAVKKNSAIGLYLNTLDLLTLVDYLVAKLETLQKDSGSSSSVQKVEKTSSKKRALRVKVEKVE